MIKTNSLDSHISFSTLFSPLSLSFPIFSPLDGGLKLAL